jgi:hypothetical protein
MLVAIGVDKDTAARDFEATLNCGCRDYGHAKSAHFVIEQTEKRAAMDAEAEQPRAKLAVGNIENSSAGDGPAVDPEDDLSLPDGGPVEAQFGETGQTRRLQHEPGADRARGIEALEQPHVVAVACQECGAGQTGGTGSGNGDLQRHASTLVATKVDRRRRIKQCGALAKAQS